MAATARLEVRVRPDSKARLERAAALAQVPLSDFVRSAAEDQAEQVLRDPGAPISGVGTGTAPAGNYDVVLSS